MWRSNYHEDWERRKSYLIRSLFQDIPVLSPVPEDRESLYGAISPSNVPESRPYSPLPPLIIEKMPDKHDHPKRFYQDLEKKMKKLYKKLFYNEESSSIEDLIEIYADDLVRNLENESISTVKLYENRSQEHSFAEKSPSNQTPGKDRSRSRSLNDSITPPRRSNRSDSLPQSIDSKSSESVDPTQVTTVVEVHNEPSSTHDEADQTFQDIYMSPVLECHQIGFNKPSNEIQCDSINDTNGTEKIVSSNEDASEHTDQCSSSERSQISIEVMRRQNIISPSLGSLHNEPINSASSKHSSNNINTELQSRISLPEENVSSEDQRNLRESSSSCTSFDFNHILSTSTPKLKDNSKTKRTSFSRKRPCSQSEASDKSENNSIMVTKRKKYGNMAIQTSFISESDIDDAIDWNQLKKNFFVGMPKIFKLCPCNDHSCKSNF